jgi:hypothetical protein
MNARGAALVLLGVAACAQTIGCKRRVDEGSPRPAASVLPVDHQPGGLARGKLVAFDVPLPEGFHFESTFQTIVTATGAASPKHVVEYLQPKLGEGKLLLEPKRSVFDHVRVLTNPKRILVITVGYASDGQSTKLTLEDVTPPPAPTTTNPDDIKRAAGLGPDGKLLQKEKLE